MSINFKYLIIVEANKFGFISQYLKSKSQAEEKCRRIFDVHWGEPLGQCEQTIEVVTQNNFKKYSINSKKVNFGKTELYLSDGFVTCNVIKIDLNTFNLEAFIKERESNLTAFEEVSYGFAKVFPDQIFSSN